MSAKENPVAVMGWQEIEGVVRSMVEQGSYMGANESAISESRCSGFFTYRHFICFSPASSCSFAWDSQIGERQDRRSIRKGAFEMERGGEAHQGACQCG